MFAAVFTFNFCHCNSNIMHIPRAEAHQNTKPLKYDTSQNLQPKEAETLMLTQLQYYLDSSNSTLFYMSDALSYDVGLFKYVQKC